MADFLRQEAFAEAQGSLEAAEQDLEALSKASATTNEAGSRVSAESLSKKLNGIVSNASNDFLEAKKHVAALIADEKRLALQHQQQLAHAATWAKRATKATATNNAELAREAIARKDEYDASAQILREQWSAQKERVDGLKRKLHGTNVLIERAKHTMHLAIARKRYADAKSAVEAACNALHAFLDWLVQPRTRKRGLGRLPSAVATALDAAREAVVTCEINAEVRGLKEQCANAEEWERRAAMAFAAGSLELAEAARARQRELEEVLTFLQAQNNEWQVTREALRATVSVLEGRVESATRTLQGQSVAVNLRELARELGALKTALATSASPRGCEHPSS